MKTFFGGGAVLAAAILTGSTIFYAPSLSAGTIVNPQEPNKQQSESTNQPQVTPSPSATEEGTDEVKDAPAATGVETITANNSPNEAEIVAEETAMSPVAPAEAYTATAYSLRGRTASGRPVSKGVLAADPRVLPLGTRVRLEAGTWSGVYTVADTGGAIKGRKIDVWVPSNREACKFGRRKVKLTVLSYGGRRGAKAKPATTKPRKARAAR